MHISGTISAYESLTLRGYDVVAVVLEDHGLLNEGRIMSYICEQASCSSATPCSKRCHYMVISDNLLLYDSSLLVFLKAQSTEVVALLFDACASWWTQGPNAILQIMLPEAVAIVIAPRDSSR